MGERFLPKADGDCFRCAVDLLMHLTQFGGDTQREVYLVHGMVTGTGGGAEGVRYCHAWVEEVIDLGGYPMTVCKDSSRGDGVYEIPAGLYYSAGSICEDELVRHSVSEVKAHILDTLHYGPWSDFPEPYFVEGEAKSA